MIEIDCVLGKNFIITNHSKPLSSLEKLKLSTKKLESLTHQGMDFVLHKLIDQEVDNFSPILENVEERLEAASEQVTKSIDNHLLSKILSLKKELHRIKRYTLPQREKLSQFAKEDLPFISKKVRPYFRDVYDHAIHISDSVDALREEASSTYEAYMSSISNKMNQVMKTLSVIATITLPLTVISSIYGTNFLHLPGATTYNGFWMMLLGMFFVVIIMLGYFKRKQWF